LRRSFGFLKALPAANARDMAGHYFVNRTAQHSPEPAAEWVVKISDEKQRGQALVECVSAWLRSDRAAAEAWLEKQNVSPEIKRQLLAPGKG